MTKILGVQKPGLVWTTRAVTLQTEGSREAVALLTEAVHVIYWWHVGSDSYYGQSAQPSDDTKAGPGLDILVKM